MDNFEKSIVAGFQSVGEYPYAYLPAQQEILSAMLPRLSLNKITTIVDCGSGFDPFAINALRGMPWVRNVILCDGKYQSAPFRFQDFHLPLVKNLSRIETISTPVPDCLPEINNKLHALNATGASTMGAFISIADYIAGKSLKKMFAAFKNIALLNSFHFFEGERHPKAQSKPDELLALLAGLGFESLWHEQLEEPRYGMLAGVFTKR